MSKPGVESSKSERGDSNKPDSTKANTSSSTDAEKPKRKKYRDAELLESAATWNANRRRGYRRCVRCFARCHVKLKKCDNCKTLFPLAKKLKSEYDPIQLTDNDPIGDIKIFSIKKQLSGIPSRCFVQHRRSTDQWRCLHKDCLAAKLGVWEYQDAKSCVHIENCGECKLRSTPLQIDWNVLKESSDGSQAAFELLRDGIMARTNKSMTAVHHLAGRSFAVCCSNIDVTFYDPRYSDIIISNGMGHCHFLENYSEQKNYNAPPCARFSCECEHYRSISRIQVKQRGAMIRCLHYYLVVAAINSNVCTQDYFRDLDLRTGRIQSMYGLGPALQSSDPATVGASSKKTQQHQANWIPVVPDENSETDQVLTGNASLVKDNGNLTNVQYCSLPTLYDCHGAGEEKKSSQQQQCTTFVDGRSSLMTTDLEQRLQYQQDHLQTVTVKREPVDVNTGNNLHESSLSWSFDEWMGCICEKINQYFYPQTKEDVITLTFPGPWKFMKLLSNRLAQLGILPAVTKNFSSETFPPIGSFCQQVWRVFNERDLVELFSNRVRRLQPVRVFEVLDTKRYLACESVDVSPDDFDHPLMRCVINFNNRRNPVEIEWVVSTDTVSSIGDLSVHFKVRREMPDDQTNQD